MRSILRLVPAAALIVAACTSGSDGETSLPEAVAGFEDTGMRSHAASGNGVQFLGVDWDSGETTPEEAATAWFEVHADVYGVAEPGERLTLSESTATKAGTVVRFAQTLDGLEVFAGDVAVVVDGGTVTAVVGAVLPDTALPEPSLSADEAADIVGGPVSGTPTLVVHAPAAEGQPGAPTPAWLITTAEFESGVPISAIALVDAVDGALLLFAHTEDSAENWEVHDARNALDDEGAATLEEAFLVYVTEDGNTEQVSDESDADADNVAANLSAAWNYFFDTHGRDGHDGNGGVCIAYVHVGVNWRNATAGDCRMRFGDALDFAGSLDVAVHEFTHSVERHIVDLVYQGQSGAISEHYADFFAAMVDRSDWELTPSSRVMGTTNPMTVDGYVFTEDDNGGVHTNSAIGNAIGFRVATEIGRDDAEQIWYQSMFALTPRISYGAWACVMIDTAAGMVGDEITEDDAQAVTDAMEAAGLVSFDRFGRLSCDGVRRVDAPGPPPTSTTSTVPDGTTTTTTGTGGTTTVVGGGDTTTTGRTTTTGSGGAGVACLVGSWEMDHPSFEAFLNLRIQSQPGTGGVTVSVSGGSVYARFQDDGAFLFRQDDFTTVLNFGAAVTRVTNGVESGTYQATEETLTLDATTVEYTVNGAVASASDIEEISISNLLQSATYECEGDTLVVSVLGGMFRMDRIDAIPSD